MLRPTTFVHSSPSSSTSLSASLSSPDRQSQYLMPSEILTILQNVLTSIAYFSSVQSNDLSLTLNLLIIVSDDRFIPCFV